MSKKGTFQSSAWTREGATLLARLGEMIRGVKRHVVISTYVVFFFKKKYCLPNTDVSRTAEWF